MRAVRCSSHLGWGDVHPGECLSLSVCPGVYLLRGVSAFGVCAQGVLRTVMKMAM